jgi:hypothetical protein
MSLLPDTMDKTMPTTEAAPGGTGRPVTARVALLAWLVLMLAAWLLLGIGAYVLIRPDV